jgi:alginate O-acetyltransferase complex protein AlgI
VIFSSFRFLIFLPIVLALYYSCRTLRQRNVMLLVASYFFYGCWDWRFLWLLFGSTVLDYTTGALIYRSKVQWYRRFLLILSIVGNIGTLCYFKYADFFIASFVDLMNAMGVSVSIPLLNVVLPVGISFYSFQTLTYSFDIYRGRLTPTWDFIDFALFVSFFTHLVAGPIVRAAELLPQVQRGVLARRGDFAAGIQRFAAGFAKKMLIADNLAPYVDRIFADPNAYDGLTLWFGCIGFGVQCYCDFAGYTDMAIGCARLMGFWLPENFRWPFLATNVADFWRRWHITLYSFMRDYLYIPLGGSRVSPGRQMVNALFTMTIVGLWHGAAWGFVLWGFYNGVLVVGYRLVQRVLARAPALDAALERLPGKVLCIAVTDVLFFLPFTVFRSVGPVGEALANTWDMLTLSTAGIRDVNLWVLAAFGLTLLGGIACELRWGERLAERVRNSPLAVPLPVVGWALFLLILVLYSPRNTQAFIYFQF